jgi:hypothetical protein
MKKDEKDCCSGKTVMKNCHHGAGSPGTIYGMGLIGALFYFLQGATNLGMILLGIGKAIVWPAMVIFKLLTFLKV